MIDAPDCIPSVGAFGRVCLSGDYQHVTYITDTGRISAVPASFSKDDAVMVYHDPVVNAQAAASALSRHGHNKARAKIRAKCDEMAAELGWPLPDWSKL